MAQDTLARVLSISAINAGGGGGHTYTAGADIDITNDIISFSNESGYSLTSATGSKVHLTIDNDYKVQVKLANADDTVISESEIIDLPLESVVVSGSYDTANKKIILTLQNGTTIPIPIGDLIDGLATKDWVGEQGYAVAADLSTVATSGSYNDLSDKPTIPDVSGKQDKLTAGDNITISEDNVISASGGGSTIEGLANGTGTKAIILNNTDDNVASASYSVAEGAGTSVLGHGKGNHAEGIICVCGSDNEWAGGNHAEGRNTVATNGSHAEGYGSSAGDITASSNGAHAEGYAFYKITASGVGAHAEGYANNGNITASGDGAHAEGNNTIASYAYSHAEGLGTRTGDLWQHVQGKYNNSLSDYADIVGNGSSDSARSNAYALDWSGNGRYQGDVYVGCDADSSNGTKLNAVSANPETTTETLTGITIGDTSYAVSGGGSEPDAYVKSASVDGNTLTLTNKDDTTVEFTPEGGGSSLDGIANGTGTNVLLTGTTDNSVKTTNSNSKNILWNGNALTTSGVYGDSVLVNTYTSTPKGYGNSLTYSNTRGLMGNIYTWANGYASSGDAGMLVNVYGSAYNNYVPSCMSEGCCGGFVSVYTSEPGSTYLSGYGSALIGMGLNGTGDGSSTMRASKNASFAQGCCVIADSSYQHAAGQYNVADSADTYAYIIGNGTTTSNRSNAFTVDWSGNVVAAGTVTPTGADYCEYFEFADGNKDDEDRMGLIVALDGGKIVKAGADSEVLGITSGTKGVIGDAEEMNWSGKYEKDKLGRYVYEDYDVEHEAVIDPDTKEVIVPAWTEHVHTKKISSAYDPTKEYTPRSQRPEWYPVGLVGKIYLRQDGTLAVGDYVKPTEGGIGSKSTDKTNIRVLEVIDTETVRVLLK